MALSKSINTRYNVPAVYWHIAHTVIDWKTEKVEVVLLGYVSQASREADAEPIDGRGFLFEGTGFTGFGHDVNNTEVAYEKIKTNPEFADATDVLEAGQTV